MTLGYLTCILEHGISSKVLLQSPLGRRSKREEYTTSHCSWPNFQPAATFGGCVQSCWDVLGCWDLLCCLFILGQDLAIVSYCFSLRGYYLSSSDQGFDVPKSRSSKSYSQGTSRTEVPWAVFRPVHVFVCSCVMFVCISRSGASPCSCTNEKLLKVSGQQLHITERRFCALAGLAPLQLDEQLVQALRMKLSGLARDEVLQSWRSSNRSINKFLGQFGNHFATNSCWV